MYNLLQNLFLLTGSTIIGLTIVNIYTFTWLNSVDQRSGFPRQSLKYIPALNRWKYPDIYKKYLDKRVMIVGDSYAEGYGDSFVKGDYNYSFAHHLNLITPYSYSLNANGGSFLARQLFLLNNSIEGEYAPSVSHQVNLGKKPRLILTFYEGNDLEDYFRDKKRKSWINGKNHHKSIIQRYFPTGEILANFYHYNIKKHVNNLIISFNKIPLFKSKVKDEDDTLKNNYTIKQSNNICIKNNCLRVPNMQSASPQLTNAQVKEAINFTVSHIKTFKDKYNARICLVYIPSPATIYSPKKIYYKRYNHGPLNQSGMVYTSVNTANSNYIRTLIMNNLRKIDISMIDSTSHLTTKAKSQYLHGINDHKHFNYQGYKFLAEFIAKNFDQCLEDNS